jgi:hypothetical protein
MMASTRAALSLSRSVGACLFLASVAALSGCSPRGGPAYALVEEISRANPEMPPLLYSTVGAWEKAFGAARCTNQRDGGTTFFYWPTKGFGIFAHSNYQAQYRHRTRAEWKVTSFILFTKRGVSPLSVPVAPDTQLQFERLQAIRFLGRPIDALDLPYLASALGAKLPTAPGSVLEIPEHWTWSHQYGLRFYSGVDGLQEIEIFDPSLLSDYD